MYFSNHFQKSIALELYSSKAKELLKNHGLFEIYDASYLFLQEFIGHEIIAYDTRKINLDELLSAIVQVLSEWKSLLKCLKKAISNEILSFENLDKKVLFLLGGLSNKVFSNNISDYQHYLVQVIREIWMNHLTLDFGKLEHLSSQEINYALLILNEEKTKISFQIKNKPQFADLLDLTIKRLEYIQTSQPNIQKVIQKAKKEPKQTPFFKQFLKNISQKQLIDSFISNQICTSEGNFIFQKGGRNPFPSPVLLAYLPEILNEMGLFDLNLWEKLNHKDKIQILSQTFGIKNNPSFYSNMTLRDKNTNDLKFLRFSQLIKNALQSYSTL